MSWLYFILILAGVILSKTHHHDESLRGERSSCPQCFELFMLPVCSEQVLWQERYFLQQFFEKLLDGAFSSFQHLPRHFLASHCNLLGGPAVAREDALILFNRCQVVIEFAYTAFTAGPVGPRLVATFTHGESHGMELVPDSTVEHLAYVSKCPQL